MRFRDRDIMETEDFHAAIIQELKKNKSLRQGDMPPWHDHFLDIWDIIKNAETARNNEDLFVYHKHIKTKHKEFVQKIDRWLFAKQSIATGPGRLQEERDIKLQAADLKPKFEKGLYRYTLCFLYLNRLLVNSRRDISHTLKLLPDPPDKMPEINTNIGFLLKRAYREQKKINLEREKLRRMTACLRKLEEQFMILEEYLKAYLGQQTGERTYIGFRACLRHMHFGQAKSRIHSALRQHTLKKGHLLSKDKSEAIIQIAMAISKLLQDNLDDLKRKEDMILDSSELRLLYTLLNTSELRVHKFTDKYTSAYLAYQLQFLLKQAFRLGQIGSFETLFLRYEAFIKGMTDHYDSPESVQAFEQEVVSKIQYTVSSGMTNISDIFEKIEAAETQLYEVIALIRDCHRTQE